MQPIVVVKICKLSMTVIVFSSSNVPSHRTHEAFIITAASAPPHTTCEFSGDSGSVSTLGWHQYS